MDNDTKTTAHTRKFPGRQRKPVNVRRDDTAGSVEKTSVKSFRELIELRRRRVADSKPPARKASLFDSRAWRRRAKIRNGGNV